VGGCRVQHYGDEGPDVVEADNLGVKSGDVVGIEPRGVGGLWGGRWCVKTRR
jgi:hypothetical protein